MRETKCSTCTSRLPVCGGQDFPGLCVAGNFDGEAIAGARACREVRGAALSAIFAGWTGGYLPPTEEAGPAPAYAPPPEAPGDTGGLSPGDPGGT